jgi:serine/threonine-protein kinase MRCK
MPTNKNSGFKGYHLPFVGFTFTENCFLNDCHSLVDFLNLDNKPVAMEVDSCSNGESERIEEYKQLVAKLEKEKQELVAQLNSTTVTMTTTSVDVVVVAASADGVDLVDSTADDEKMIQSGEKQDIVSSSNEHEVNELKEQLEASKNLIEDLNGKLSEVNNAYDIIKQAELDQKNKIKHLERNLRALKNEKDELYTVILQQNHYYQLLQCSQIDFFKRQFTPIYFKSTKF